MLAKTPHRTCHPVGAFYLHRTTASRPTGAPAGQKQPGEEEAQAKQAEAAARAEGQSDRAGRDSDQPNTPPDRQTSHQTRPEAEIRQATANIKAPPFYQNERGAGTRLRAGHPPRFALAGRGTGRQGPRLWAAFAALRGACLGLAGRGNGRHSRPQAAFPAPRRARMREEAALAPPVRAAVQIAGPRRGKAAGRRARPGLAAGSGEGRGPATPGGECVGRAARHGLRRRRGRAGKAGRSAADRAGGADGPTAPTSWGPGRPGAPAPQPSAGCARGKAREAARLRAWPCGGHGWPALRLAANLTGPGLPGLGRHISRTAAGRPGGRRHRRRTGWAGCRPAGRRGGWDVARPQAGRGREPLSPGR